MNTILSRHGYMLVYLCCIMVFRCTTHESTGIEITNGTCTGVIYLNTTPERDVTVSLIRSDYDPSLPGSEHIASTITDANGRYTFDVEVTDFYNIIAEKGSLSCMQDSISILADVGTMVDNDTLEAFGYLAGTIKVKPGNNPHYAIILLLGTDRYASPYDTLGNFGTLALSAGTYHARIFTSETGYDIMDTTIIIRSGDTTHLDATIPLSYAPSIQNFSFQFDSARMYLSLDWSPLPDTAAVRSLALHRFVNNTPDTTLMLDNWATSYTDDCLELFEDTVRYELAAVGINFKEGYKAATPPMYITGKNGSMTKSLLSSFTGGSDFRHLCVTRNGSMFITDQRSILKINQQGVIVDSIKHSLLSQAPSVSISSLMTDNLDHIYADVTSYDTSGRWRVLNKFDSDCNLIATLELPMSLTAWWDDPVQQVSVDVGYNDVVVVGDDGSVYLQSYTSGATGMVTTIEVYNPDLSFRKTITLDYEVTLRTSQGDKLLATRPKYPGINVLDDTSEIRIITIFDTSFAEIASFESIDAFASFSAFIITVGRPGTKVSVFSDDIYITKLNSGMRITTSDGSSTSQVHLVLDRNGNLLARHFLPGDFCSFFRSRDRLYGISHMNGPVLYTFNLEPLL